MTKADDQRRINAKNKAAKFLGMMDETEVLAAALGVVTFGDLEEVPSDEVKALWEVMAGVKAAKAGSVERFNLIKRSETAKKVIAAKMREMADALDILQGNQGEKKTPLFSFFDWISDCNLSIFVTIKA